LRAVSGKIALLFLKKKKQKDFCSLEPAPPTGARTPAEKSFLVLFFKKEQTISSPRTESCVQAVVPRVSEKPALLFLKKKKQKDFYSPEPAPPTGVQTPVEKSFLVLFFKKEQTTSSP
jgi:hypothetical protein